MVRYIHGSEDSIDIDVYYVFDKLPDFKYCQEFCSSKDENRNIIIIKNGAVEQCFKGTIDEVNNGLYYTYNLHQQEYPLLINKLLKRDILIKDIRVLRGLLSYLSRTLYRTIVKEALKGSWAKRIEVLEKIDWKTIEEFNKTFNKTDVYKVYAFQLGQSLGLHEGIELYTKSTISKKYPKLRKYLYRENAVFDDLYYYIDRFIKVIKSYEVVANNNITKFYDFNKIIDMKTEKYIKE